MADPVRTFLRHTVATVAYRGAKALRDAPADFGSFRASQGTRTPLELLAHINDLYDWALSIANDAPGFTVATPGTWDAEIARFHAALAAFDARLATDAPIRYELERIYQGPIADSLTHVGQLAMLRRMHGAPIRAESFTVAGIEAGRVGRDQAPPPPGSEFD